MWKRQFERVTGEFVLGARLKDGVEGSNVGAGDFAFDDPDCGSWSWRGLVEGDGDMSGGGAGKPW